MHHDFTKSGKLSHEHLRSARIKLNDHKRDNINFHPQLSPKEEIAQYVHRS